MITDDLRRQANLWTELIGQLQGNLRHLRHLLRTASRPWGLSDSEAILLLCCCQADPPGIAQQHLVHMTGASPAQVSAQIESLHRRGLVTGHRSPRDRRQQVWQVCPERAGQMREFCGSLVHSVVSRNTAVSDEDLRELAERLRRLRPAPGSAPQPSTYDSVLPAAGDQEAAA